MFDRDYSNVFFLICNTNDPERLNTNPLYVQILSAFRAEWNKHHPDKSENFYTICCDPDVSTTIMREGEILNLLDRKSLIVIVGHYKPERARIYGDTPKQEFDYTFFGDLLWPFFLRKSSLMWRSSSCTRTIANPSLSLSNRNVCIDFSACFTGVHDAQSGQSFIAKFYQYFLNLGANSDPISEQHEILEVPLCHVRGSMGYTYPIPFKSNFSRSEPGAHTRVMFPYHLSKFQKGQLPFYPYLPNEHTHRFIAIDHNKLKRHNPNSPLLENVPVIELTPSEEERYYLKQQEIERVLHGDRIP